jgi:hypothetical protein
MFFERFLGSARNIHALFQAKMPGKAHGYCVLTFQVTANNA